MTGYGQKEEGGWLEKKGVLLRRLRIREGEKRVEGGSVCLGECGITSLKLNCVIAQRNSQMA